MRYRLASGFSMMMVAGAALAQVPAAASSAPLVLSAPVTQDSWQSAADRPAASTGRADGEAAASGARFKFKDRGKPSYVTDGPGNPVDRDTVLGTDKPTWEDGRPPLNCAMSPLDPACRH